MKRILIYSEYYKRVSGYSRTVRDLLPIISKEFELAHVALGNSNDIIMQDSYFSKIYPTTGSSDYWAIPVLNKAIDDFKPDIVLTLGDFFSAPSMAYPLSMPDAPKWVFWGTLDSDPLGYDCRTALEWVDYIFYHSDFSRKEVEKAMPLLNGETLYPATNEQTWFPTKRTTNKRFTMMLCARNQQRKNVPVLLDAIKMLKESFNRDVLLLMPASAQPLTFSGYNGGYNLRNFIEDRGIGKNIEYLHSDETTYATDEEINDGYNRADIQVQVSTGEGLCLPIIEGFATGLPTLGIEHSAIPELVTKERGWLVKPSAFTYNSDGGRYYFVKPEDIAYQIDKIIDLSEEGGIEGKRGACIEFASKYTVEKVAKRFIDAMNKVVDEDIKCIMDRTYEKI